MKTTSGVLALMILTLGGCGMDLVSPGPPDSGDVGWELISGGVRVTLTVDPAQVTSPGMTLAALRYENTTSHPVVVTSSYGCLAFAGVYRGSERIPFPSTSYACTAAITSREIAPGAQIGMDWPLHIGEHGVPLEPGEYRFIATLNTHGKDLERTFTVQ